MRARHQAEMGDEGEGGVLRWRRNVEIAAEATTSSAILMSSPSG